MRAVATSEPGYICPSCRDHVTFKRATEKIGDWWRCSEMGCVVGAKEIGEVNPGVPLPVDQPFTDYQRRRASET
jgi:hypothetical protein